MPRYKDASGCFNKEDARELGLTAAVVWFDILNSSELFGANPIWYDQRKAGERLGIPYQTISRAIKTLEDAGRLSVDIGYRPNSSIRTTWITILVPDLDEHQKSQNEISKKSQNEISILKDTNKEDVVGEISNAEVHMLPSALYSKLRSVFPGSSNDMRKKKVEAVERLQNEFELSDETIIDGVSEIAKHPTYKFKDGTEFTETLASLLLGDIEKTAEKLVKKAEAGKVKEEKKKKKISRTQAMLNAGVC